MQIAGGISLVNVISGKESIMFANADLKSHWQETRLVAGLKYLRTIMMGTSIGAFSATNVNVGYQILPGKLHSELTYGVGIDYQVGGFNFGQIPMLGAILFAGGSLGTYWWDVSASGAYGANSSTYEIQNNWRCDGTIGRTIYDNVMAVVGLDYRDFVYRTVGTTGGYSSLSLLALSLGLGISY